MIKGKTGGPQKAFIAQIVNHSHVPILECIQENLSDGVTNARFQARMASAPKASSVYWYADSGCTQNMTDQRSWFTTFTPLTPEQNLPVEGIGGVSFYPSGVAVWEIF